MFTISTDGLTVSLYMALSSIALVLYSTYPRVCVCVFVCASCLHFQEADKRIGASVDRDDEPLGPYIPAVRKAMSGSRAGG